MASFNQHHARVRGVLSSAPLVVAIASLLSVVSCSASNSQQSSELQPQPISASPSPESSSMPLAGLATPDAAMDKQKAPPQKDEVAGAITRVFVKTVSFEESSGTPFVAGDFNGDGSQDLAVLVKPNEGSLSDVNNELANWTLEDPAQIPIPGTPEANQLIPPKPVKAQPNDSLLAIIHGAGKEGWRSPEARQTYLLRTGGGSGLSVRSLASLRGDKAAKLPPLRGDAVTETVKGRSGLIFWTGARYAWFPVGK